MTEASDSPLILGGHSFIAQLGGDPPASEEEQRRIVESCLNRGIRWFDTTYQPERVALGKVLELLGRRGEARILAWNFFKKFLSSDPVGEAECYRPEHLEIMLQELRTSYVDCIVMVPFDDPRENQRQKEILIDWQKKGYVGCLGLWISDLRQIELCQSPFRFAIRPFNVTTKDAPPIFAACKRFGWETIATSPFVRGWELERLIVSASSRGHGDAESLRPTMADLMLRFSLFQSDVDRVIVGMRKSQWVSCNMSSVSKGPLSAEELQRFDELRGLNTKKSRLGRALKKSRWYLPHRGTRG